MWLPKSVSSSMISVWDVHEDEKIVNQVFKTKSEIWKHFGFPADATSMITDQKNVVCWLCKAVIMYSGNTSNYHLQWIHKRELKKLRKDSSNQPGPSVTTMKTKQLTLGGTIMRVVHSSHNGMKHKMLVDATAGFISVSWQVIYHEIKLQVMWLTFSYHGITRGDSSLEVVAVTRYMHAHNVPHAECVRNLEKMAVKWYEQEDFDDVSESMFFTCVPMIHCLILRSLVMIFPDRAFCFSHWMLFSHLPAILQQH